MDRVLAWRASVPVVSLVLALGFPTAAHAAAGDDDDTPQVIYTASTTHNTYDVYYGTLTLTRPDGSVYRTVNAFSSQIRVTQTAADQIAAALNSDARIANGFAGTAPDGGTWITNQADPVWWENPPTFDAQGAFNSALAAAPQLAAGETASCTDTTAPVKELSAPDTSPFPNAQDAPETTFVNPLLTLINTNTSYLVIDAHLVDRVCTVIAAVTTNPGGPTLPTNPTPPAEIASADIALARLPSCLSIPGVVRDQRANAPGGGTLILQTRQVDDPAQPLRLAVQGIGGARARAVAFAANGRALTAGAVPVTALQALGSGARNKLTATVTLASGRRVVLTQYAVVLKCNAPAVTCTRLTDGRSMRCTSKTPLGGRRVRITASRTTTQVATGSATVIKGRYTAIVRSAVPLAAGTYAYKHVVTTALPRQRYFMIRKVTVT